MYARLRLHLDAAMLHNNDLDEADKGPVDAPVSIYQNTLRYGRFLPLFMDNQQDETRLTLSLTLKDVNVVQVSSPCGVYLVFGTPFWLNGHGYS
jgi:hypothetical protein